MVVVAPTVGNQPAVAVPDQTCSHYPTQKPTFSEIHLGVTLLNKK